VETTSRPPRWIKPQLTRLAEEAPQGTDWLHEIKCDGYRMRARASTVVRSNYLPGPEVQGRQSLIAQSGSHHCDGAFH
jgi:hypothetical protein